ncbi:MAG: hypothetical protein WKG00_28120 [Polyangiaceae bacterium]
MRPRVRFLAAASSLATLAGCALLGPAGCAADEELPDLDAVNTAISVTPNEFLLGVPCSPGAGAMKAYVAVVTDRGPVDAEGNTPAGYAFDLPASGPTPCTTTVAFRNVVVGHRYDARVYAYDLEAKGLAASSAGCPTKMVKVNTTGTNEEVEVLLSSPGSTLLCHNPTGEKGGFVPAVPAWTRSCGTEGFGAAVARPSVEVRVAGCLAEGDNGNVGTGETAIVVDPLVAMAPQLSCLPVEPDPDHEPEATEIDTFDVIPEDTALPDQVGVDCDPSGRPAATYTDVEPGASYRFRIEAGNADAPARWATSCDAVAFEGVTVTASCDTLTDRGTLRLELEDCPDGATYHLRFTNTDTGEELKLGDADGSCPGPGPIPGLPSGRYELLATIEALGAEPVELGCQATVVPAATTTAVCAAPAPGAGD